MMDNMEEEVFDQVLQTAGYSLENRDAIRRGMSVTGFKGQLPREKKQYDMLIAALLGQGRLQ